MKTLINLFTLTLWGLLVVSCGNDQNNRERNFFQNDFRDTNRDGIVDGRDLPTGGTMNRLEVQAAISGIACTNYPQNQIQNGLNTRIEYHFTGFVNQMLNPVQDLNLQNFSGGQGLFMGKTILGDIAVVQYIGPSRVALSLYLCEDDVFNQETVMNVALAYNPRTPIQFTQSQYCRVNEFTGVIGFYTEGNAPLPQKFIPMDVNTLGVNPQFTGNFQWQTQGTRRSDSAGGICF